MPSRYVETEIDASVGEWTRRDSPLFVEILVHHGARFPLLRYLASERSHEGIALRHRHGASMPNGWNVGDADQNTPLFTRTLPVVPN